MSGDRCGHCGGGWGWHTPNQRHACQEAIRTAERAAWVVMRALPSVAAGDQPERTE